MLLKPIGIQKRTVTAILGTALLAFVIFGLGLALYRNSLMEARVHQFLSPYAEMIAVSATPAADLGDKNRALEILNSLRSNPQILRADIIKPDGGTLATYPANQAALDRSLWNRPNGAYLGNGTAELVRGFSVSDPKPAHVFIRMSLALMQQRDRQMLLDLSFVVGLILAVVALLQFLLLRRWVLSPLARLAAIAETAGRQGDYSQRVPAHDRDEFGQLGRSFNLLLASVAERETALRRLSNFQQTILKDAADAIISTDTKGLVTSFNPAAEWLLGYKAEEVVGSRSAADFHDGAELAARAQEPALPVGETPPSNFEIIVAQARRSLPMESEWNYLRKDGSRVPVLLSVTTLRDEHNQPAGYLCMAVDIQRRKQAVAALQESRWLYDELVSSVPLGVYRAAARVEGDFHLEYVSDRFCELTGLTRKAVLADVRHVFGIIHPEEHAAFDQANAIAFLQRTPFLWEGRAIIGGQTRWLHFESRPTLLPDRLPFWTGVVFDITDRKTAEAEVRQKNSLLAGTLQATADGILAVAADGKITSYNRQFVELWHVPQEMLDANDLPRLTEYLFRQLNQPSTLQAGSRPLHDISKADTFDTLEFLDGRVFERFSRPQMVEGRVVGRVWSFRDVTARHWAVAALRESEHKFKTLFETANDAILIMNETVFLDCNHTAEVMYGCPRERIIGESPVHFSPERQADGLLSAEKATEKVRAALSGTPQFFEWIHVRGDGTLFNAEVSLNRLDLRGQTVIQTIVRDITARKRAEAAQHEAEELYRTLVHTSPDGITVLDMTGCVQFSSPKALELFYGTPDAETQIGRSAVEFVSEASRPRALELLRGALAGQFPPNERLLMRRSDGHEFVAELNGTLLRDGLGVPRGIMVITRDVTERQRQEDELKNKNAELERFTYTVSHDLKSPLITIKGFAGALLADAAAGRTDRLTGDLKRIVMAADKMGELLNGLLELSRIGRIVNPPVEVSMNQLAEEVLALLAGSIAQRQARITVQPGLPDAFGDAQRLQEVLQNLVENALKFSAPSHAPEIEIGFKTIGGQTAYFVRDCGRGIEARFLESIFGLFNKLDTHTEGTGIGLALVRRIVEFHGGTVWVESAGLGQGATFCFTLAARKALSVPPAR